MRFVLEPRFLFDASVAAATHRAHDLARDAAWDTASHAHETASPSHEAVSTPANLAAGSHAPDRQSLWTPGSFAHSQETSISSVLFVDPRVANWQTLANGVTPGTKVVVVDPSQDGLAQVSAALRGLRDVQSVNFLTYGAPGQIELGATPINDSTLLASARQVAGWRDHLADHAKIQLWGCDVGAGTAGAAFVSDLHGLTGAGVAASTTAIGAAAMHGDWTLDRTAGVVEPVAPFSAAAIAAYENVLDAPVPTVTISGPSQVLLGGTFSDTVTFANTAPNAVGYGPVVEVIAPHNSLDVATLTSASYLGTNLTFSEVTFSTTVAGHVGTLGALDPVIVDASGKPVFDTAPAGAVAGDVLYAIQLPFGSYTPGQPAATVTLNFQTTDTSVLTAQHGGQQVNIDAIGGFIYGADPLNNPGTDLPIQGVAGHQGSITPADGEVTAASSLVLATVTSSVSTQPGEGETATGPDFPGVYTVTITPAPATAASPIIGTTLTIPLPDNVEYTGGPITVGGSGGSAVWTPAAPGQLQGGTVTVTLNPLSGVATPVNIPFFVPETTPNGTPILDPATGAPTTITLADPIYENGAWDPLPGSADYGHTYALSGSVSPTVSFTAKSLAVQMTALDLATGSSTLTYPDDPVQYTVKFEVSDYFSLDALSVKTLLSDGLVANPNFAPILSLTHAGSTTTTDLGVIANTTNVIVNGQTVPAEGSNANWNFINSNQPGAPVSLTPGQTEVDLDPAPTLLTGGETGSLVYQASVLDKYTNTNSLASITEGDTVSSSTVASALVETGLHPISDGSVDTLTVPVGSGSVYVVAVNGLANSSTTPPVTAGDTITYAITRTLSTGDYASLDLKAYLPLPVIDAADPAANGSTVTSYALATNGANAPSTFYPGVGEYSYFTAPSPFTNEPAVQSATVDALSNDVAFSLGARDDPTNVHNQVVTVYFTVTVSTAPFADGLDLTAQGTSTQTSGSGNTNTSEAISQVVVGEPNLTGGIKDGTVSLVDNADAAKASAVFTLDGTSNVEDPTTYYQAAGVYTPAGAGSLFISGNGPTSIGNLQDLNVAGADGSDTVRIVTTIENSGHSGAWDVDVSDLLPTGYALSDVVASSVVVVRSGDGAVLIPKGTGSLTDLFTAGGVTLEDPSGISAAPTLYSVTDPQHRNVMTVSFDLKLLPAQSAGSVLLNTANIVNYTNISGGAGFVVDGNPVGGNAASLVDTATVTTESPTLAKTFGPSDIPVNDNVDAAYPNATVVVGETRPITITVGVPEGTINNGSSDVLVTEQLPVNEVFTGALPTIVGGNGVTLGPTSYTYNGNLLTFDLGPQVKNTNADAFGDVTITYDARFVNGANIDGTKFTSTANLIYSGTPVPSAQVTFIEHDPILAATLTNVPAGPVYSGEVLTYIYTVTNTGIVQSQQTGAQLNLPADLTYVSGTLHLVSQINSPHSVTTVNDTTPGVLTVTPGTIDAEVGSAVPTLVYTFQEIVNPDRYVPTKEPEEFPHCCNPTHVP